jgi:hypothetical protein
MGITVVRSPAICRVISYRGKIVVATIGLLGSKILVGSCGLEMIKNMPVAVSKKIQIITKIFFIEEG